MTPDDSAPDKELLERYRRASDATPAAPSDSVRAAILAEGRRVALQSAKSFAQRPLDGSRGAANDPRWKMTAWGTAGAALVAGLIFAPRFWENSRGPALQTSSAPVAARNAPAAAPGMAADAMIATSPPTTPEPLPQSDKLRQQASRASPAEPALAQKSEAEKNAPGATAAGYAPSDVSTNSARSVRADLAEPSGLLLAVSSGDMLKIRTLVDHGAALNERDELGRTPLLLAVMDGRTDAVRLLLERGADANAADRSGRTPLLMARQASRGEIATLLERSGAHE